MRRPREAGQGRDRPGTREVRQEGREKSIGEGMGGREAEIV